MKLKKKKCHKVVNVDHECNRRETQSVIQDHKIGEAKKRTLRCKSGAKAELQEGK